MTNEQTTLIESQSKGNSLKVAPLDSHRQMQMLECSMADAETESAVYQPTVLSSQSREPVVQKKSTSFKLEPEYIPGPRMSRDTTSGADSNPSLRDAGKMSPDRHRAKIRKIVCVVGVSLTVICIVLVAISFALGQEIDRMVTHKQKNAIPDDSPFAFQQRTTANLSSTSG
ncbi:hypothetical protein T11_11438 [Trichinella zimbabwensis]|uniref:Uncharacterized protein n=2 Tax=Trichinella TaxID=6333 RepID=A0A0V1MI50_9BILA|nr:hypothetical protein T11_11438 [Trichinella zimbabwensis]KRZ16125.1 hypothetical protein T11_11438 [Trichinella zimbabwensis]KRZ71004.1 hypothetical protein T10_9845 [Trichinella papuae]KRZ71005.1 hypothetical protein T10_9845 [Trichinella papuae]KRZ71006.1 hypothetical protein T10_9845 [Trichinella papuae]